MTNEGAVALAKVAKREGLTQAAIARELGLNPKHGQVTRWMSGDRIPTLEDAAKIEARWPKVKAALWTKSVATPSAPAA